MTATVEGWITYAAARGSVVVDDADSAAALVRAQDYITHHYVSRFAEGYDADSPNVDEAVYEAAALELAKPGLFSATYKPSQQKVLVEVKGIKWQPIGGATGSAVEAMPVSTKIEAMLRPYLITHAGVLTA